MSKQQRPARQPPAHRHLNLHAHPLPAGKARVGDEAVTLDTSTVNGQKGVVGLHDRHIHPHLPPALPARRQIPRNPQHPLARGMDGIGELPHNGDVCVGCTLIHPVQAPELQTAETRLSEAPRCRLNVPLRDLGPPLRGSQILANPIAVDIPKVLHLSVRVRDGEHHLALGYGAMLLLRALQSFIQSV